MTLNSAKMHQDVGGDAEKRILAKMQELLDREEPPEHPPNGKLPSQGHISPAFSLHCQADTLFEIGWGEGFNLPPNWRLSFSVRSCGFNPA